MDKLISCKFNIDTACVELRYVDGEILSIDCIAVEDEFGYSSHARVELDWLIYNDPLSYAQQLRWRPFYAGRFDAYEGR